MKHTKSLFYFLLLSALIIFDFLSSCTKIKYIDNSILADSLKTIITNATKTESIKPIPNHPIIMRDTIIVRDTIMVINTVVLRDTIVMRDTVIISPPPVKVTNIDIDGNVYDTVRIGNQTWMKQNLRVTKFNDGTDIPLPTYDYNWWQLITPGYCWYNNDISNNNTYGALYNWWAAFSGKLCPVGWHVPSVDEWIIIAPPYGHASFDLMESGTSHWIAGTGTNTTGFTALPGGVRDSDGFRGIGEYGYYWTSNFPDYMYSGLVWDYPIPWDESWGYTPTSTLTNPQRGLSIRCLKDN